MPLKKKIKMESRKRPREIENNINYKKNNFFLNEIFSLIKLPKEYKKNFPLNLNFNYWFNFNFISNLNFFEFFSSILQQNNYFFQLEQEFIYSFLEIKLKRVILIFIDNLSPINLATSINNLKLTNLLLFSSVPIRHTIPLTLQQSQLQQTYSNQSNNTQSEIWRYSEVTTASSLLFWPVIPTLSYEEVNNYRNNLLFLFQKYRLFFKV